MPPSNRAKRARQQQNQQRQAKVYSKQERVTTFLTFLNSLESQPSLKEDPTIAVATLMMKNYANEAKEVHTTLKLKHLHGGLERWIVLELFRDRRYENIVKITSTDPDPKPSLPEDDEEVPTIIVSEESE
jgi:hypothetical protein